jgi:hypothetical protein
MANKSIVRSSQRFNSSSIGKEEIYAIERLFISLDHFDFNRDVHMWAHRVGVRAEFIGIYLMNRFILCFIAQRSYSFFLMIFLAMYYIRKSLKGGGEIRRRANKISKFGNYNNLNSEVCARVCARVRARFEGGGNRRRRVL